MGESGEAGQVAGQVGGEPAPQLACAVVEQHGGGVVVAVGAQWPSEPGVVSGCRRGQEMSRPWGQRRCLASRRGRQGSTVLPRMRREWTGPKRGRSEGGEHARVRGDRLGYAFAAGQAGADELAGVAFVDLGAGRADALAAVAARGEQHAAGFGGGVVHGAQLAGGQVDGVDAAFEPDGPGAQAGAVGLADFAVKFVPGQGDGGVVGGLSHPRAGSQGRG